MPKRYPSEQRERAARMVMDRLEHRGMHPPCPVATGGQPKSPIAITSARRPSSTWPSGRRRRIQQLAVRTHQ